MKHVRPVALLMFAVVLLAGPGAAQQVFSPSDLFAIKTISNAVISPDGDWVAYTVSSQRPAADPAGPAYSELYVVSTASGKTTGLVTGAVNVGLVGWKPKTNLVSFVTVSQRGKNQLFLIPARGGEPVQVTDVENGVASYAWHPSGKRLAYISTEGPSARETALEEKGYGFLFYEENLKNRNAFMADISDENKAGAGTQLTSDMSVWSIAFSPDGNTAVIGASKKNLFDYFLAFHGFYVIDLKGGAPRMVSEGEGRFGNYALSPNGKYLAYAAALDQKDNSVSQAFVVPLDGGKAVNLTPKNFKGHIEWVGWKDDGTVVYRAGEGVNVTLNAVHREGGEREILLNSKESGLIFGSPSSDGDFGTHVFVCSSPAIPGDLYVWRDGEKMVRLTNVNAFLEKRNLGEQRIISYKARDGQTIEGLLMLPVGYQQGKTYPLIMLVHGGPEDHHSNSWLTGYFEPGQVLAGKGYVVLYTNYRSSTGYGLDFAAAGYGDPAGVEFNDLADAIDYLVKDGIADKERVGMGGFSYGGYASAWFATYYTRYIKAACVFNGITDALSKRGTTDIPYEELFVHSGKRLEDMWKLSLERSPIYYAKQSKTATLILGGMVDQRVHPSQDMELYRRMKMNGHPAVRLVQYPGEGHGNQRQPGRIDVLYRTLDWYDWYVRDRKPLDGPMPPLDISGKYGLNLPE